MSRLSRMGAAARRCAARLVPAARRDWVEAVFAEAPEVSPGLRRLGWYAGGVRLVAKEALMRRRIGSTLLFALAAGFIAWEVWPGSPGNFATWVDRVDVITLVLVLAGLALLVHRLFGPADDSLIARILRVGAYVAILALIPARATVELFLFQWPRGDLALLVYRVIGPLSKQGSGAWFGEIVSLVVIALYAAAILWMTSRRSLITPATLAIGTGAGIVLGVVMYAVAPLGLSKAATNPWLPGSDIDPLVVLAWILLLGAPVAAAVAAGRRHTASSGSPLLLGTKARQMLVAGLLTNLVGALFVTVFGTGTTALMLKAAWFRDWLYHGQHLLFGVIGLRPVLGGDLGAIMYGHEITAATDAGAFGLICIAFPLIALGLFVLVWDEASNTSDPRRGGGPPGPEPAPAPPGGGQPAGATDDDVDLALSLLRLYERGPSIEQDPSTVGLAGSVAQPVGSAR